MSTKKTSPGKAALAIGFLICIALIIGDWFSKVLDNDSALFLFIMVLIASLVVCLLFWFIMEFINWIKEIRSKLKNVESRSYTFASDLISNVCKREELSEEESARVIALIELNEGYISPMLLRRHLKKGYGQCARLCEALFKANLARESKKGYVFVQLERSRRSGFM